MSTHYREMTVRRDGDEIVLPVGMSYQQGRDWLAKIEANEETVVKTLKRLPCFPLDGLCAMATAVREKFGATVLPDSCVSIPCDALGSTRTAYLGRFTPPAWEGGVIDIVSIQLDEIRLQAVVKRKFSGSVDALFDAIQAQLATASLYRGKAIRVRFPDDNDWTADMLNTAPTFMDTRGVSPQDLILNADVQFALESNVFTLIQRTAACRAARIPLRHGMMLAGPFGTGKTLTAKVIAGLSQAHGWTFIYLEDVRQVAHGLRVAEMFAPAVLFSEDIDCVVGENRNGHVNDVLNVLDGIDTKSKPIITVLTTNRLEAIHRSLLRAGRIDTVVEYSLPDAASAWRFVELYCRDSYGESLIDPACNRETIGTAFAELLPAFIAEAVQKAKRYCLLTGDAKVSEETLLKAAAAIRNHSNLVSEPPTMTHERRLVEATALVGDAIHHRGVFTSNGN